MSTGNVKFENILNPEEAFKEFESYLIDSYLEDYGYEYLSLIRKRISNTYYLFESNPCDTYEFFKKNRGLSFGLKRMFRIEREYYDYLSVMKRINKFLTKEYKEIISSFYNTTSNFISDDFLKVDFESFSFENIRALHSSNISDENKEKILKRQNKYLDFCLLYGVKPITDFKIIDKMIKIKCDLELRQRKYLLDESLWGKRIKRDIYLKTGKVIDSSSLVNVLYDSKSLASVCQIPTVGNDFLSICYCPVMKNYSFGAIDKVFFHENRHVIESGINITGFSNFSNDNYLLINELRTQENAIRDSDKFRVRPLFANFPDSLDFVNVYERLFDYCGPFIKKYLLLLNKLAINNDIVGLESLFGKGNLQGLEDYLKDVDNSFFMGVVDSIDFNKQRALLYFLDSHFSSRHEYDNLLYLKRFERS